MSTSREFFHTLEKNVSGNKYLPLWVGELYLEYHRGTYTSMARNKRYNRKSEFAYQNEEMYALLDSRLNGTEYPEEALREAGRRFCGTSSTIFFRVLPSGRFMRIPRKSMRNSGRKP